MLDVLLDKDGKFFINIVLLRCSMTLEFQEVCDATAAGWQTFEVRRLRTGRLGGRRPGRRWRCPSFDELTDAIELSTVRVYNAAARHVYADQLLAYWNNGRMIVVYERGGRDRAEYGDKTLRKPSRRLTNCIGRGFSVTNLQYMRQLYLKHPICQTLSVKLTWSHCYELLDLADDAKRSFYEREAANSGWDVRDLPRQMDGVPFERIIDARGSGPRTARGAGLQEKAANESRPPRRQLGSYQYLWIRCPVAILRTGQRIHKNR